MKLDRRRWLGSLAVAGLFGGAYGRSHRSARAAQPESGTAPLRITGLKVTPVALPDPPLLAAGGCHGPYFLRNIVELETDAGIVGLGETKGGQDMTEGLRAAAKLIAGQNAFAYRRFAADVQEIGTSVYAGIELACLDACGKATGRRLCELLGGPVREQVPFAAYLFYRYAADHRKVLDDERLVDTRGKGDQSLDDWGEVRSPEAMADMVERFRKRWGFRVWKLKGGVLPPDVELQTLVALRDRLPNGHLLRIDPNGRWTTETAIRIGRRLSDLPLEYYEDPVAGQEAMAEVRQATGLVMSTNMCVTRFEHIKSALELGSIDVVLGDHHGWGGIPACQELGRICETVGWRMSQHSNNHAGVTMAAMIHVAAATPQLTLASDTHYPWLVEGADVIEGSNLAIRDGHMAVPRGPGVGVSLDRDKLAHAHETYRKCGMRERNDAATMQWFEPGWVRDLF